MPDHTRKQNEPVTNYAKRVKSTAKLKALEKLKDKWEGKPMHGQYPERVGKPDINQDNTHQWLRNSGLKAETEGFIIAAQDIKLTNKVVPAQDYKKWLRSKMPNVSQL